MVSVTKGEGRHRQPREMVCKCHRGEEGHPYEWHIKLTLYKVTNPAQEARFILESQFSACVIMGTLHLLWTRR